MNIIYFVVMRLSVKNLTYTVSHYKIETNNDNVRVIKNVRCWNGIYDLPHPHAKRNFAWANEFPTGVIESKIWCSVKKVWQAKGVLKNTLDDYLINWKPNTAKEQKEKDKLVDYWNEHKNEI